MTLKKLTIKGLASIADATIDFSAEPLKDAPLFLLCGETGAGKTMILDAICLALYGQTPRYQNENRKKETVVGGFAYNDPLQLVRHGATACQVTLTLRGNDGKDYEALWCVDFYVRGENKGTPKTIAWEWRDLAPNGLTHTDKNGHLTKELLPVTLGLDFDQFCRTTLLAQGKFTEFLLADENDKADILEKLTNTERFSRLGTRIALVYDEKKKAVEKLEGDLGRLTGMSAAERANLEQEQRDLEAFIESGSCKIETLRLKCKWRADKKNLVETRARASREWAEAQAKLEAESYRVDAKTVADWDLSQSQHEFVRGRNEAKAELAAAQKRLSDARAEFACCRGARDWLAADVEAKRIKVEEVEGFLSSVAAKAPMYEASGVILQNLADARAAQEDAAHLECDQKTEKKNLEILQGEIERAKTARDEAQDALNRKEEAVKAAERERDVIDINGLRERSDKQSRRLRQANEGKSAAERIVERESEIERDRKALEQKQDERKKLGASIPELEKDVEAARANLDDAERDAAHQKDLVKAGIEKICSVLHLGERCPVCGNKIEKLSAQGSFQALFNELQTKCENARHTWKETTEKLNAVNARVEEVDRVIRKDADELASETDRLEKGRKELRLIVATLGLVDGRPDTFASCVAESESALRDIGVKVHEYDTKVSAVSNRQKEKDALAKALREREQNLSSVHEKTIASQGRIDRYMNGIRDAQNRFNAKKAVAAEQIARSDWESRWTDDPKNFEENLKREAEHYRSKKDRLPLLKGELEAARETLANVDKILKSIDIAHLGWADDAGEPREKCEDLVGRLSGLTGKICSATDAEEQCARRKCECEEAIRAFVDGHEDMTEERLAFLSGMDITPLRRRVLEAQREVATKKGALEQADENLSQHLATCPDGLDDSVTDEALDEGVKKLAADLAAKQNRKGEIRNRLDTDDQVAADRKAKEVQMEVARKACNEWKALDDKFGDKDGKKIRRVIQSYVLKNVLVNANHYLRQLSPDRYELSCVGLTLTVKDAFEGGIERPAKTLSGGEGFLVSLALALGLAGMNDTGLAVDMLFIDEGFGTLSKDHLEKAIDELEKLNAICGNRKVGVISHVDRLKERINTRIEVRRVGHDPSTVEVVNRPWTDRR